MNPSKDTENKKTQQSNPGQIPLPSKELYGGSGDFIRRGQQFKKYFIKLGNLQPHHRALDVGCGVGRMAFPLTDYLTGEGGYWGFDIVKDRIDWCKENITARYPNFHFDYVDIYNKHFNPQGKINSVDFKFPYEDNFFDFAFLVSVFTHMLPKDMDAYMAEISRVLKPGGRSLITFFLLNEESERLVQEGKSFLKFAHQEQGYRVTNKDTPEVAVAYPVDTVQGMLEQHGLEILPPIHYGSWCKREQYFDNQDIVIAVKKAAA